jgi:hypothetical protein
MGKDRFQRNSDASVEREHYTEELNFTADGDELFGHADEDVETIDLNDSSANITPHKKKKGEKLKSKEQLNSIQKEFYDESEKIEERFHDGKVDQDFDKAAIKMEKVDLEMLNEEEKLIERSRIQEQMNLLGEYEDDRMKLLNMERKEEDRMRYASTVMTNEVLLEENRATIEVRENEARTFRLFAKSEEHLKDKIIKDEGEIIDMRKKLHFSKTKARSHLFGGSRDRMYSLRWNQTPSPLEVKILMAR